MKVSSKLMTVVLTAAFVLSLVGSTQAALPGFLIAGMDHRTHDSNNTLKAFDLDGNLQWEVDADDAKIGEIDPTDGSLIVAQGGPDVFAGGGTRVERYNAQTGALIGTLFDHGQGNVRGIAVHLTTGDIAVTAEGSSVSFHDVSGSALNVTTGALSFANNSDALYDYANGENVLFVMSDATDALKGYATNDPPTTATLTRNAYLTGPDVGSNYENLVKHDGMLYVLKAGPSPDVVKWDPTDQSYTPVSVLSGASGFGYATGLAFDPSGNMYIGDYVGEDVYKFTESGGTWSNQSLFIEDAVHQITWLEFSAVPEPSSLMLIVMAAVGVLGFTRRR